MRGGYGNCREHRAGQRTEACTADSGSSGLDLEQGQRSLGPEADTQIGAAYNPFRPNGPHALFLFLLFLADMEVVLLFKICELRNDRELLCQLPCEGQFNSSVGSSTRRRTGPLHA